MKITGLTGLEEKPLTVGHIGFILAPQSKCKGDWLKVRLLGF